LSQMMPAMPMLRSMLCVRISVVGIDEEGEEVGNAMGAGLGMADGAGNVVGLGVGAGIGTLLGAGVGA